MPNTGADTASPVSPSWRQAAHGDQAADSEAQRDRRDDARAVDHAFRLTRTMPAATVASATRSRAVTGSASRSAPRTRPNTGVSIVNDASRRRRIVADQPEPDEVAGEADDDGLEGERSPGERRQAQRQRRAAEQRRDEQEQRRDARADRAASSRPKRGSAAWPGSPASSRPRARRRGRRARRRATAAARRRGARSLRRRPRRRRRRRATRPALCTAPSRSELAISGIPRATTNGAM